MTLSGGPTTGKALWFVGPREIELREEPLPDLGAGEVLVRGLASLVSAGTEMSVYRGEVASAAELALPTARGDFPFPMKFAYQTVGEVEQAGPDAAYAVGDRVFAVHPHQDRFVIEAGDQSAGGADFSLVYPVPADLSPEKAAFANLFGVAHNAHLDCPVRHGDCVAISGLGVIGTFAALLARKVAGRLILIDPLEERRRRADWIGADAVVHPEDAATAIADLTDGRGVDIFFEASGAPSALQGAIEGTGQEGSIVVLSYYGNREATLRLSPEFHFRRQRIVSSQVSTVGSGLQPRWDVTRRMSVAMEQIRNLDIEKVVSHRIAFDEAPDAYRLIDEAPTESLGILLTYDHS
jgi:2-desacetyl-2-hydroxyethyl bacteriochlorophyllide A dehydrogenase